MRCSARATGTDHPRSRGVYLFSIREAGLMPGSSPLARGLPVLHPRGRAHARIIPARAGFTGSGSPGPAGRWGSSPLARGLRTMIAGQDRKVGIIPARAGFTSTPIPPYPSSQDHPRSRGVYPGRLAAEVAARGSSPLARGLREETIGVVVECGIIPARAGFTGPSRPWRRPRRDHPRSRGVYTGRTTSSSSRQGSSPLARGLQARGSEPRRCTGIIPARAGFTKRVGGWG